METYTIFCAIQHEWTPFPIKVPKDSTVGDLKKAIKSETMATFPSLDAHTLTLYRVDVNPEGYTEQELPDALVKAKPKDSLSPLSGLGDLYPSDSPPPKKTIHILVQPPTPSVERLPKRQKLMSEDEAATPSEHTRRGFRSAEGR